MKSLNKNEKIAGVLFLIAMISSISGGIIIGTDLSISEYSLNIEFNKIRLISGTILELFNAFAVLGIASVLAPVLKRFSESLALSYFSLRIVEAIFCIVIVLAPITLIQFGQISPVGSIDSNFQSSFSTFLLIRELSFGFFIPLFFSMPALILYYIFLRTKLIPTFISLWGIIAVILMLVFNLFKLNQSIAILFVLPMILNEIFMGIWLIWRGFNEIQFDKNKN